MPRQNLEYTKAEEDAALAEIAHMLEPQQLKALIMFEEQANSANSIDKNKSLADQAESRLAAAENCQRAGLTWLNFIKPSPLPPRTKDILLSAKVVRFMGLGASHLHQLIRQQNNAKQKIDFETCKHFLKMQVYVCGICVQIGENSIFEERKKLTKSVNQIMQAQFGAADTAEIFGKVGDFANQKDMSPEVIQLFYDYAFDNLKHDFDNSPEPSAPLVTIYQKELHKRLDMAIESNNREQEQSIRTEIEKMHQRQLELFDLGYPVPAVHHAGKPKSKSTSTLRRRSKPS